MFQTDVQVVDAVTARALHQDAVRRHALVAWFVLWDDPAFPERFIAQLAATTLQPYVLVGDTLGAVREQLPPSLKWSKRQPADPPDVVEIWLGS